MPDAASSTEFAEHVVAEIDTHGDPRVYALAEDYLRLHRTLDCLLPANGCATVEEAVRAFGDAS